MIQKILGSFMIGLGLLLFIVCGIIAYVEADMTWACGSVLGYWGSMAGIFVYTDQSSSMGEN
jgi:hypothetical protein